MQTPWEVYGVVWNIINGSRHIKEKGPWYFDLGASCHVTNNKNSLTKITKEVSISNVRSIKGQWA
jgi:hypothetical protein